MKIRDSLYEYPGFTGTSVAHLRVYRHEGSTVAVVGQLTDNPSTSITNQARVVIDQLRREYGDDVIVIEHYSPGGRVRSAGALKTGVCGMATSIGGRLSLTRHRGTRLLRRLRRLLTGLDPTGCSSMYFVQRER